VISDRRPQFAPELTKELNKILEIEMKLLTSFHPQTDSQTERINQELEQQNIFSNQSISVYSKLWKGVKNGGRYQEKSKSKRSNRIFRKNKKDSGESWSSIEEDTRENKATSK